jgi:hypothetical protein
LGNLRELAESPAFSWLNAVLDFLGPAIEALLDAYLPSLLLVLLLSAVPPLLRLLSKREGYVNNLGTEQAILGRLFLFLVINVFLVATLAGSVLNKLDAILQGEESVPSLLAASLPGQGPFFINYLLVKVCFVTMDLLRPHILFLYAVRALGRRAAVLDFVNEARPTLDYGPRLGWDLLVVVIALTYSLLYPFILVFALAYFAVVAVAHRHNIIFLHRPRVELQGQLWPRALTLFFVAVLIFQWTMVGWFSLQTSAALVFPVLGTVLLAIAWYKIQRLSPDAPDIVAPARALWERAVRHGERTPLQSPGAAPPTPAYGSIATVNDGGGSSSSSSTDGEDKAEPLAWDDDDVDGLSNHGRLPLADVLRDYFVEPIMIPPAPGLLDDPYNPWRPQV